MKTVIESWESRFFISGWRQTMGWITLVFSTGAALIFLPLFFSGTQEYRPVLLGLVIICLGNGAYAAWGALRGRRYPVVSLSHDVIEWGSPSSVKRNSVQVEEVVGVETMSRKTLVLRTRSEGKVRINLGGLSRKSYESLRQAAESKYGLLKEGSQ